MSLKKALFKPAAFFKGFLLPLAQDASSREAVIVGSILAKVSIPSFHSSAALIKLTEFEYTLGSGYFIKVLIGKRYALPTAAIDMLVDFFYKYTEEDPDEGKVPEMPVMWHQTLLNFVQMYRANLTDDHVTKIKVILKIQTHHAITAEIRREMFGMVKTANKDGDVDME